MERPSSQAQTAQTATISKTSAPAPTPGQLSLLRVLSNRTGMTFKRPVTIGDARREIVRLKKVEATSDPERQAERETVSRGLAKGPASSVQDHELEGYGSTARYATTDPRAAQKYRAGGHEHCCAIGAFPNPYRPGYRHKGKVVIHSRADARNAYRKMLKRLIRTGGRPVITKLAALDGTLTGCYCAIHPCDREVLADAAAWAAGETS